MYLNIVNNISFNHRKRKSETFKKAEEKTVEDDKIHDEDSIIIDNVYNSIFYGQLTKNWLLVTK